MAAQVVPSRGNRNRDTQAIGPAKFPPEEQPLASSYSYIVH